jgi:hypothetical protein
VLSGSLVLASCASEVTDSDGDDGDGNGSDCTPGDIHECTCKDGSPGVHECLDDGTWEMCICGAYGCGGKICPALEDLDVVGMRVSGLTFVSRVTAVDQLETLAIQRRPDGCCTEDDKCGAIHPQLPEDDVCREIKDDEVETSNECPDEQLGLEIESFRATASFTLSGCCTENGECGVDFSFSYVGCLERTSLPYSYDARSCTY